MKYYGYGYFLKELGFEQTHILQEADLLILPGGADINPALYGHKMGPRMSYFDPNTDAKHINMYFYAIRKRIPIIGICRGAQLSCAINGGALFQHVTGHAGRDHYFHTPEGETFVTNSLHHQMMDLSPLKRNKYEILGWSNEISNEYWSEDRMLRMKPSFKEPEIVFFKDTKTLAVQGHPEMGWDASANNYLLKLIDSKLLKK